MFWFGHAAAGYLFSLIYLFFASGLNSPETNLLLLLGALFGILPDIDVFFFFMKQKSFAVGTEKNTHRHYITHAPLFWIIISILIYIIAQNAVTEHIAVILLLGTLSHFLMDSIEFGVMWLWPYSRKRFSLISVNNKERRYTKAIGYYWDLLKHDYSRTKTFYLEVLITIAAVVVYSMN
jgi:membrane-bound metal-dependent hydrolase YbcI (DUF457 family)